LSSIEFLRESGDNTEFMWSFVQLLKKTMVEKGEVLYVNGEFAEEIYFIKQGKVNIYSENGYAYLQLKDGQHFGEVEVIFKEPRMGKAAAVSDCLIYTMERDDLEELFDEFKDVRAAIIQKVKEKRDKLRQLRD